MLTIYFTRHGQTEWNVQQRMQGWGNGELTAKGIADAKSLAVRLKDTHLDRIYASTSKRAYETAEIIAEGRDIPVVKADVFREMSFGDWEGVNRDEVKASCPEDFHAFWETPHLFNRKGSETFADLQERVKSALQMILEENQDGGTVLVVAHSIFLRMATATIKGLPIADIFTQDPPANTSLTKVTFDGNKLAIEFEGDMSHSPQINA
ncbi:MAG: histidine phosphatase family protein [Bacillus sp. (in: firmicutes)]